MTDEIKKVMSTPSMQISKQNKDKHNDEKNDEKHEKTKHSETKPEIEAIAEAGLGYQILVGNLMLERRNVEHQSFSKLQKNNEVSGQELLNIEEKINELELKNYKDSKEVNFEEQLEMMTKLKRFYFRYASLIVEENQLLSQEQFEIIEPIIESKSELLQSISQLQANIFFDAFKDLEEDSEKKIKANKILSDIHNRMKEILNKENENSVMIENQRNKILNELQKSRKGMRTISKYSTVQKKSHFINTVK